VTRGAVKGNVVVWATGCMWLTQGFLFIAGLGLARMLDPAAFGIASLAIMATSLVRRLLVDGVTLAVVAEPEIERPFLNASFLVSLLIGGSSTVGLTAVGLVMRAHSPGDTLMPDVFIAFACLPLIDACGAVQQGLLQRQMRFKEISSWMLAANVVVGVVSLLIAYAGGGVWSLVAPQLLLALSATTLMTVKSRWIPGLRTTRQRLRGAARSAGLMASSSAIVFTLGRGDILALGAMYGAGVTGLYTFGKRLVETFRDLFVSGANNILLSQTAALQESGPAVSGLLLTYVRGVAALTFPLFVGLACVADLAVPVVLGEHWVAAVPALQVLAFAGPPQMLSAFMIACLMGLADRRSVLVFNLITGAFFAVSLAVLLRHGAVGVAWAYLLQAMSGVVVAALLVTRRLPIRPVTFFRAVVDVVAINALMGIAVMGLRRFVFEGYGPGLALSASVASGVAVYGLAVALLLRTTLLQMAARFARVPVSEPAV
jgi:O-antigen/teichoic acid export membrane protein